METRANYALIGLFTLAVLAGAFFFVFWFSGKDASTKLVTYRIIFTGSVSGLSRGANVMYNGLKVGEVTTLGFATNDPNRVVARIQIDATTPMNVDTRARLEFSGLTGVASIQLSGGKPGSAALDIKDPSKPPIIYADRSDFQDLLETAQRLARRTDEILTKADQLFSENEGSINRTVKNVETFTGALAANSEGVSRFLESTGKAADEIATLSKQLQGLSQTADKILAGVNPEDVSKIVSDLRSVTDTVAGDKEKITAVLEQAAALAARLNETSAKLDAVVSDVGAAVKGIDAQKLARTLDNVDRFSTALGDNSERVGTLLRNADEFGGKLNRASDRLDGVLADAGNTLRSVDGTAKSIGRTLEGVDPLAISRTVGNIDRFSQTLAQNAQRFDDVLRNVDDLTGKLNKASERVDGVLADAGTTLRSVDGTAKSIDGTAKSVTLALQGIEPGKIASTVANLDKVAAALGGNASRIDDTLRNASELSAKLNRSADQVDDVLKSAQKFLGSGETQGALNEVADMARSIRKLAENLDKRTADITSGIGKVTGSGVRDFEAFASDGRRTLGEINRTLRSLQANPQQLLFGQKSTIPDYQGRP